MARSQYKSEKRRKELKKKKKQEEKRLKKENKVEPTEEQFDSFGVPIERTADADEDTTPSETDGTDPAPAE